MRNKAYILPWIIFTAYCLAMVYLLFLHREPAYGTVGYLQTLRLNSNLVPFRTITKFVEVSRKYGYMTRPAVNNLIGNLVAFIPFGVFVPLIHERARHFGRFITIAAVTIASIELIQGLTTLGSLDIDDFILNIVSASIGFGLWKICDECRYYIR